MRTISIDGNVHMVHILPINDAPDGETPVDRIFEYSFDELPLLTVDGFEAGLVAGSAEISYNREGEWSIASICLDGHRKAHYTLEQRVAHELAQRRLHPNLRRALPPYLHKPVELDAGSPLYSMISDTLEGPWAGNVQDAVAQDMFECRAEAAEVRAEMRRDDRMMGLV